MKPIYMALALLAAVPAYAQQHKKIIAGNTRFAFELYHKLEKNHNVFFSPYSVSAALGMTYAGAKGKTATEMYKVLHVSDNTTFHKGFTTLMKSINALNGDSVKMSIANRLFGEKEFTFLEDYLNKVKNLYDAPLEQVDFKKQYEASRLHINKWVETQTNDKIKDLIPMGVINEYTRLVLVNAIYFYGDWAHQFYEGSTREDKFYTTPDSSVMAKLMQQSEYYEGMGTETFLAVRIPYKGNTVSMEIYLPHQKNGLAEWERTLNAENYAKWSTAFSMKKAYLTLPKFSMTSSASMSAILKDMGMPMAFNPMQADFSRMTGKKNLYISEVVHKAFIDVGEKGTEAAAATAVVMAYPTFAAPDPTPRMEFRADHPFFFVIRDNKSGTILFMGRVTDPAKA